MAKIVKLQDRAILRISGADNRKLLQGLITNNIEKINDTTGIFAALLTPQGKFLHDFFLIADGDDLLMDVLEDRLPDLLKRLKMYRLRAKVEFTDESDIWQVITSYDDMAASNEPGEVVTLDQGWQLTDPRLPAIGYRYILKRDAAIPEGDIASLADWQQHLVSIGIPSARTDVIIDKTLMLEAGYEELNAIDFRKGCYVGQEITARSKYRANIRKRLLRVVAEQDLPAEGVITADGKHAGDLRTIVGKQAIAFMRLEYMHADNLEIDGLALRAEKPDWVIIPEKKE